MKRRRYRPWQLEAMTPPDPWRGLAAAVLLQAIKDAQGKGWCLKNEREGIQTEARAWLAGVEGRDLAAVLDLDMTLADWLKELDAEPEVEPLAA